jgi:AraC-like DNA-binding protein
MPLYVDTVGYNTQKHMIRPEGFSTDQLLFTKNGQGYVRLYGKAPFCFGPMQYMLLPAHTPHEYYQISDTPWEVGYISFSGMKALSLLEHFDMKPFQLLAITNAFQIWSVLDELCKLADVNETGMEWEAVRLCYSLFLDLNRMRLSRAEEPQELAGPRNSNQAEDVVEEASRYLQEHFNENLSISNVATSLGLSQQYLNRKFREAYGFSMLQYVQKLRIDKGLEYLESKDALAVKDIAERLGMETNYFIRMFRRATGTTPDRYRKHRTM